jgi:hypothetical protein
MITLGLFDDELTLEEMANIASLILSFDSSG